jgi:hypothetical protein
MWTNLTYNGFVTPSDETSYYRKEQMLRGSGGPGAHSNTRGAAHYLHHTLADPTANHDIYNPLEVLM